MSELGSKWKNEWMNELRNEWMDGWRNDEWWNDGMIE